VRVTTRALTTAHPTLVDRESTTKTNGHLAE
jgi:hypothetical protein